MKARVFFDAFAECLVNVAVSLKHPHMRETARTLSVRAINDRHGPAHAENTGHMFDRLMAEAQKSERR